MLAIRGARAIGPIDGQPQLNRCRVISGRQL